MICDPALVLLDVARGNSHEVPEYRPVVEAIGTFLERYRASDRTPIFVRSIHHPYTMSANWSEKYDQPLEEVYNAGDDASQINPDIAVREEDPVITKHRYSGFYQTDLGLHLSSNDVNRVLVGGFGTLGAVAHTVHDAFNRDYLVTVLSDCVGTRKPPRHDEFLEKVERTYGRVERSTDVELPPIEDPPFGYLPGSTVSTVPWQGAADSRTN